MAIAGLTKLDERSPQGLPLYKLTERFDYRLAWLPSNPQSPNRWIDWTITIEPPFKTDFASIPRIAHWLYSPADSRTDEAALIHDWLYRMTFVSRFMCDAIFREVMLQQKAPTSQRLVMYYAVRMFGGAHKKKRRAR